MPCGLLYDTPFYEACSFGTFDEDVVPHGWFIPSIYNLISYKLASPYTYSIYGWLCSIYNYQKSFETVTMMNPWSKTCFIQQVRPGVGNTTNFWGFPDILQGWFMVGPFVFGAIYSTCRETISQQQVDCMFRDHWQSNWAIGRENGPVGYMFAIVCLSFHI